MTLPDDPRITALGDDPVTVECPQCDGEGYIELIYTDQEVKTCPRCNGKGFILNPDLYDR